MHCQQILSLILVFQLKSRKTDCIISEQKIVWEKVLHKVNSRVSEVIKLFFKNFKQNIEKQVHKENVTS